MRHIISILFLTCFGFLASAENIRCEGLFSDDSSASLADAKYFIGRIQREIRLPKISNADAAITPESIDHLIVSIPEQTPHETGAFFQSALRILSLKEYDAQVVHGGGKSTFVKKQNRLREVLNESLRKLSPERKENLIGILIEKLQDPKASLESTRGLALVISRLELSSETLVFELLEKRKQVVAQLAHLTNEEKLKKRFITNALEMAAVLTSGKLRNKKSLELQKYILESNTDFSRSWSLFLPSEKLLTPNVNKALKKQLFASQDVDEIIEIAKYFVHHRIDTEEVYEFLITIYNNSSLRASQQVTLELLLRQLGNQPK